MVPPTNHYGGKYKWPDEKLCSGFDKKKLDDEGNFWAGKEIGRTEICNSVSQRALPPLTRVSPREHGTQDGTHALHLSFWYCWLEAFLLTESKP